MPSIPTSDAALLAEWARSRNERAFHSLVERYAGLVHAAAKRTCGDESMAREASQLVFILLAGKASSLASRASLAGWLHTVAVMQTRNLLRSHRREQAKRLKLQTAMNDAAPDREKELWLEMKPVIDDALASLPEKDREALLMHFYRSLSAREIAETLGIATAAAKKRIERATEKLRGKLAARGVNAAGRSIPSVMLAGFALDSQGTGVPVSLLVSKATAATAGGVLPASIFATTTAMKVSVIVPPLAVVLAAGLWIMPKREAIASLERKHDFLVSYEDGGRNSTSASRGSRERARVAPVAKTGSKEIDWESIFRLQGEGDPSGRVSNFRDLREVMLDQRLKAMSTQELLAELDRIAAVDAPGYPNDVFEGWIYRVIAEKDPLLALTLLEGRLGKDPHVVFSLGSALKGYVKDHPAEAIAWLDRQIAAGRLDAKGLQGRSVHREQLEGIVIKALMSSDLVAAAERLAAMRPEDRPRVLEQFSRAIKPDEQVAYARLVRGAFPESGQPAMIAKGAWIPFGNFKKVDDYLGRIEASPAERAMAYEEAAKSTISTISSNRKLTRADLDKTWQWLESRAPASAPRILGEAMGKALGGYSDVDASGVAELLFHYNGMAEGDGVLRAFFNSPQPMRKKEQSRQVAALITDEALRAEIIELLK